jgi:hypothetical protein
MDVAEIRSSLEGVDPFVWIGVAIAAFLLGALIAWAVSRSRHTKQYRDRYGEEYDRVYQETGDRNAAVAELDRREQRVQQFNIRSLTTEERENYSHAWRQVQSQFVDDPSGATRDADHLVEQVMHTRGYPVGDFEQQADDVSVDHPRVVSNYRSARVIAERNARGEADTEELRQALVHYRELFDDLLETQVEPADAESRRSRIIGAN